MSEVDPAQGSRTLTILHFNDVYNVEPAGFAARFTTKVGFARLSHSNFAESSMQGVVASSILLYTPAAYLKPCRSFWRHSALTSKVMASYMLSPYRIPVRYSLCVTVSVEDIEG